MPDEKCGGIARPDNSTGSTPYGSWQCVNGQWEWVPEFGRAKTDKKKK